MAEARPEDEKKNRKPEAAESDRQEDDAEDIVVTDEVIAVVAGAAAMEVETVAGMSTGLASGIVEALGRKNPTKGVKIEMIDGRAVIDLFVIVRYGHKISDIAWEIQENVKETVENMTGVAVDSVNIHVQGIDFSSYDG